MRKLQNLLLVCLLSTGVPAWAGEASPLFEQGLAAVNAGKYAEAESLLARDLQSNPADPVAHYLHGVALHSLGRYPEATKEYNYVLLNTQDPELIRRVQLGLQALARLTAPPAAPVPYPSAQPYQAPYVPPPPPATVSGMPALSLTPAASQIVPPPPNEPVLTAAVAARPAPRRTPRAEPKVETKVETKDLQATPDAAPAPKPEKKPPVVGATGHMRIVDCYTNWSGWCKNFEPLFKRAQAKYGKRATFEQLDADAPENQEFIKTYTVQDYPTILFFTPKGDLVKRINGAPQKFEDLDSHIHGAFPSLH